MSLVWKGLEMLVEMAWEASGKVYLSLSEGKDRKGHSPE